MASPDLDKLVRLAAPVLEAWVRADPQHQAFVAELGKYLSEVAKRAAAPGASSAKESVPIGVPLAIPTGVPKGAPLGVPVPPPEQSRVAAVSVAAPAAGRAKAASGVTAKAEPDLVGRMIGRAEKEVERLVGGLSPQPATAPGVVIPVPPAVPSPPATAAVTPVPALGETAAREVFLLVQKASHHRDQFIKCLAAKDLVAGAHHIGRAVAALEASISKGGTLRSGDEAREVLMGMIEAIPEKMVLAAETEKLLDRIFAASDAREEAEDGPATPPNPAAAARGVLAGKTAVLIGGDLREARRTALQADLGLRELRWIRSTPTNPATKFEADIKRAEVDLVLVAIRWVRHATAWAAVAAATKHKKPLVRLPGGLGSNAVGHEVLEQVAGKLRH